MVTKTIEVRQRMAELALENFLSYDRDIRLYIRVAHATKIIDPNFQPPIINMKSAWQREYIIKLCKEFIHYSIEECTKLDRLEYFTDVLNIIEREL